jgi:hypothetical protein
MSGNIAFDGMKGTVLDRTKGKGAGKMDGISITARELKTQWPVELDPDIWVYAPGKLPILAGFAPSVQDSDFPKYITD